MKKPTIFSNERDALNHAFGVQWIVTGKVGDYQIVPEQTIKYVHTSSKRGGTREVCDLVIQTGIKYPDLAKRIVKLHNAQANAESQAIGYVLHNSVLSC